MKENQLRPKVSVLFVCVMAGLMSLVALSIDTVLPAMGFIRNKFNVFADDGHWILTSLFIGLSAGQLIFGPISDTIGRKRTVYVGVLIFTLGSLISFFASGYFTFILGRIIQGFGVAAPRIVSQAIIRDVVSGPQMARLNSFVMTVFIAVPVFAPILGQLIIWTTDWSFIFIALIVYCFTLSLIFIVSVQETLHNPRKLDLKTVWRGASEVLSNKTTFALTIALGCVFGCLISFLNIAQPLYQEVYGVGDKFSFYFAGTAIIIGMASLFNARLVSIFSLNTIVSYSLIWVFFWSLIFLVVIIYTNALSLSGFLIFSILVFTTFGFMFSNLNALALEPMGHIAGTASAVIATVSNIIAISIGATSSYFFTDNAKPLITVFVIASFTVILTTTMVKIFSVRFE